MVAWDELDEKMKEIDRVLVRGLPKFLADFKLQINRK
jgi:hypothetical protein